MIISSQRYIDDETVAKKIDAADYVVFVSPEFEVDDMTVQVVLDGHHSLAAAKIAGVEPEYRVMTAMDHDAIGIEQEDPEAFLEITYMDSDYYDIDTGATLW